MRSALYRKEAAAHTARFAGAGQFKLDPPLRSNERFRRQDFNRRLNWFSGRRFGGLRRWGRRQPRLLFEAFEDPRRIFRRVRRRRPSGRKYRHHRDCGSYKEFRPRLVTTLTRLAAEIIPWAGPNDSKRSVSGYDWPVRGAILRHPPAQLANARSGTYARRPGAALMIVVPAVASFSPNELPSIAISGEIVPARLPRSRPTPISLHIGFTSEFPSTHAAPNLTRIELEFRRNLVFNAKGLPSCTLHQLLSTYGSPVQSCRRSLVGHGMVVSEVPLPRTTGLTRVEGELRAYYDLYKGQPWVLAQVTSQAAGLAYVIPFELKAKGRNHETTLEVPPPVMRRLPGIYICDRNSPGCYGADKFRGIYGRISNFELSLHRSFPYRGEQHSFVSADCPARGNQLAAGFEVVSLRYSMGGPLEGESATLPGKCEVSR